MHFYSSCDALLSHALEGAEGACAQYDCAQQELAAGGGSFLRALARFCM